MYVESCNSLMDRNKIISLHQINPVARNHEFFITMFPFDVSIVRYVELHKTIKGHIGKHFCPYILIDIDCEDDMEKGKVDTLELIKRLNSKYGVDPDELYIYFSGGKGFHVVIPGRLYEPLEPCENMGAKIKRVVTALGADIDSVDLKIYENHRIIRVENSKHKKGYYKIQLSYEELDQWTVSKILTVAKKPRQFSRIYTNNELQVNKKLNDEIILNLTADAQIKKDLSQDRFFDPPQKGNRNSQLHKQACSLYMYSELSDSNIFALISSINNLSPEPLFEQELRNIVSSAASARNVQVNNSPQVFSVVKDFVPEFKKSLHEEGSKISLCFESLDIEFKGKLRSKMGIVLGYGGSKKSMYAQCATYGNIFMGHRVIYSNMEMGGLELVKRFYDIHKQGKSHLASDELEYTAKKDVTKAEMKIDQNFSEWFGDKLIISNGTAMVAANYDSLIDEVEAEEQGVRMEDDDEEEIEMIDIDVDDNDGEEELEDRVVDIEDKLDELMSEFEELMGQVDDNSDDIDGEQDEISDIDGDIDGIEGEMDEPIDIDVEVEGFNENVDLVPAPKPVTTSTASKSPVAANSGQKGMDAKPVNFDDGNKGKEGRPTPKYVSQDNTTKPDVKPATKPNLAQASGVNTKSVID